MFVKKTDINRSKFDLLEDVSKMDLNQIMKHYFSDIDVKNRRKILANLILKKKCITSEELNVEAHRFLISMEQEKADNLPYLVNSIILNTLAYEANERIEKSIYKDYKDKNISKYAKNFIAGQYKIFRNSHEQLLEINQGETEKIIKNLELVLDALSETNLSPEEIYKKLVNK
jgi:hypothetical protein